MADLSVEICGLSLTNPTMLASGVLDETGKTMAAIAGAGAGAIVTKSIGKEPRQGHGSPCVVELGDSLMNAMGLPNPGIDGFEKELEEAKKAGVPIIGSVFGGGEIEIAEMARLMANAGADAIELNLSCPHAKGFGAEIGSTPEMVENVCRAAKSGLHIPMFAKLTPNTSSIINLAKAAERGGADAIVAINTLKGMVISPDARMPVLANRFGGLSGPSIRPIGVRCVYEIRNSVEIPIIGVGGIESGNDALEYIMAGASSVQIGTAVWRRGPEVFGKVCGDISEFMDRNGFETIAEMVGIAHEDRH